MIVMVSDNQQTIASLEVGTSLDHLWVLEREFLSVKRKTARRVHYSEKPRSKNALPSTAGSVIGAPVFILTPSDCCLKLW